jgi:hypothetical protein
MSIGYEGLGDLGGPRVVDNGMFGSTVPPSTNPSYEMSYGEPVKEQLYIIVEKVPEGGHTQFMRTKVDTVLGRQKLNEYLLTATGRLKNLKVYEATELSVNFELQLKKI